MSLQYNLEDSFKTLGKTVYTQVTTENKGENYFLIAIVGAVIGGAIAGYMKKMGISNYPYLLVIAGGLLVYQYSANPITFALGLSLLANGLYHIIKSRVTIS